MIYYALDNPIEPGKFGLPHVLFTLAGLVGPVGAGLIALGVCAAVNFLLFTAQFWLPITICK